MPPGPATSIVLFAACTLFALKPVRRPASVSLVSYLMGMVFNEVPAAVFLYLLLPLTVLTVVAGDIPAHLAWIVDGVWLLLVVGLALIWWRQRDAVNEVNDALEDALGHDPEFMHGEIRGPGPGKAPGFLRILAAPFPFGRLDVKRIANRSYGDAGRRNLLDLYHHRSRPERAPVLIYFHGGDFRIGNKRREGRPLFLRLASRGWVTVSANYRLRPQASFPDYVIDVKKVIGWIRENGPEFGADPDSIFVAGSSAGGHIASIAALTENDPLFQPGFEEADTSVAGFISLYGYYGGLSGESTVPSSPFDYLDGPAPPAFLAHGELDTVVPVEGARRFADELRESSPNPVVFAELSGTQHGFDMFHSERSERVIDGIEAWAARVTPDAAP
ncbi:MAG: alpha/beta hydrolase [Solirubrobacterales bacterium]